MPSGPARYQGYPSHLPRTGMPPEAYPAAIDSSVAKEQSRDAVKNRGGLPKHVQDQHKADSKLSGSSPGGMYPVSYPSASGRSQHLLPPQSENPPGRGECAPSREKAQNKPFQEQELRAHGKTTMTAADFMNAIMGQISCETSTPETGWFCDRLKDHQGCPPENQTSSPSQLDRSD